MRGTVSERVNREIFPIAFKMVIKTNTTRKKVGEKSYSCSSEDLRKQEVSVEIGKQTARMHHARWLPSFFGLE